MKLTLILDTNVNPNRESVRGLSSTRHLLFHSNGWDLDLVISRLDERVGVFGQVMPREQSDLPDVFNAVAVLLQEDAMVQSTTLSARGEFEFRDVPEAHLKIELFLKAEHLTASFRT
jgi:hypothetical protein